MAWRTPSSAAVQATRPLSKGVIRDRSPQYVPDGGFVKLQNFFAGTEGLLRRPGYLALASAAQIPYKVLDYITIWGSDGLQQRIALTDKTLWRVYNTAVEEIEWVTYNTGTVSVSGVTVTGSGTSWLSADIKVGDLVRIGTEEGVVENIISDTEILIESATITNQIGVAYKIQGTFTPRVTSTPDWTTHNNILIIADGKRPLIAYTPDTETVGYWIDNPGKYPSTGEFIASVVVSFNNRIYVGDIQDAVDGRQRNMIRWSGLADPRDFSIVTNYLYIPSMRGTIQRLMPLGPTLLAYFDDSIYVGTPTNFPLLPLQFDQVETGGNGILGKHAVFGYLGGHFWVGQDDIYLMTADGPTHIGIPVFVDTIKKCQKPGFIYVAADPSTYSIAFGFPVSNEYIEEIWRYDYRAKAWSMENTLATMLANPLVNEVVDWASLTPLTWDTIATVYTTWDSMGVGDPRRYLYRANDGILYRSTNDEDSDETEGPIEAEFITKDHDYDVPDTLKTWVRFSVKIDSEATLTMNVPIRMYCSVNRGRSWKYIGLLTIYAGMDEGYVNFVATGSTIRFRGECNVVSPPFTIAEYTVNVRSLGAEQNLGVQR